MATSRRQHKHESLLSAWLMAGLILAAVTLIVIAVLLGYSLYSAERQRDRTAVEAVCNLQHDRYTTEWQACIDDR